MTLSKFSAPTLVSVTVGGESVTGKDVEWDLLAVVSRAMYIMAVHNALAPWFRYMMMSVGRVNHL